MTPADLRAQLARLGLSQLAAARELAVDPRTVRNWIQGRAPMPPMAERMLALMERCPDGWRRAG